MLNPTQNELTTQPATDRSAVELAVARTGAAVSRCERPSTPPQRPARRLDRADVRPYGSAPFGGGVLAGTTARDHSTSDVHVPSTGLLAGAGEGARTRRPPT